jgi:uncharacterized RDD family membrane protein YckC
VKKTAQATDHPAAAAPTANSVEPAGLLRRLAALLYDTLVLLALWLTAAVPFVWIANSAPQGPLMRAAFQVYLLAIAFAFFGWFWVHGGQTLGMRAWRLRVERESGDPLDARAGVLRFLGGLLSVLTGGIGLLWLWVDRDELTWHDRLAGTRVVVLPKERR